MNFYDKAISNIARYGDTDIFPYPIEKSLFHDNKSDVEDLLKKITAEFESFEAKYPISCIKTCIPVGYAGYRLATMIDPLWDAYLLYLVLTISGDIEKKRIPVNKETIFSYRLNLTDGNHLFDKTINWRQFYEVSKSKAEKHAYIVKFDIADFYNRIYHHRLENSLTRCTTNTGAVKKIITILQDISGNVSYGLPVGGNASRILAEALLNNLDQLLVTKNIKFCRYVDDYILFVDSKEDAYKKLNYCADFLLVNEGLSLQKSKTQIMTQSEFLSHVDTTLKGSDDDETRNEERASFLKLNIHYDPYSDTANQEYNQFKEHANNHNIVELIKAEVKKSRVHQAFSKQLFKAVSFLDGTKLNLAFSIITSNLEDSLYPIYPNVMRLASKKLHECDNDTITEFVDKLCSLVENDSYVLQTENNAAYTCRVLSLVNSERSCQAIDILYTRRSATSLVKVNCIYAMTNLKQYTWLSCLKQRYSNLDDNEKRAFIVASYFLGDEGRHWRRSISTQLNDFEKLIKDWASNKKPLNNNWILPL